VNSGFVFSFKPPQINDIFFFSCRNPGPNNVSFHLAAPLTKLGESGDIPEKHKFVMSDLRQSMGVFSETPPGIV